MLKEDLKSWDSTWEKIFKENPWGKYPAESVIRFIARNFYKPNRSEVRLLEIGCGPGANIWYLAKEHFIPYGIDASKIAIMQTQERLNQENLNANLSVGDIINLPFENDFFDAVIDAECLYCNSLKNTLNIFEEIRRVLKPGGKFYSRTFSDQLYIGAGADCVSKNEYASTSEGPLAGKGYFRLTPKNEARSLYEKYFNVISVDFIEYSQNDCKEFISEIVIISEKNVF